MVASTLPVRRNASGFAILLRLADDHANARRLAEGIAELGFRVDPTPETNIVLFDVEDSEAFQRATRAREVWIHPMGPGRFRAVTHLDVSTDDIEDTLARIGEAAREGVR